MHEFWLFLFSCFANRKETDFFFKFCLQNTWIKKKKSLSRNVWFLFFSCLRKCRYRFHLKLFLRSPPSSSFFYFLFYFRVLMVVTNQSCQPCTCFFMFFIYILICRPLNNYVMYSLKTTVTVFLGLYLLGNDFNCFFFFLCVFSAVNYVLLLYKTQI